MAEEQENTKAISSPIATTPGASSLKRPAEVPPEELHASQTVLPEESAILKAENTEEYGANGTNEAHAPKRVRIEEDEPMKDVDDAPKVDSRDKVKGIAMVKAE